MKKVYSSSDRLLIGFLHGVLENHGIHAVTRNEYLAGGVGDIPPQECWPELWVVEDREATAAARIIDAVLPARDSGDGAWRCEVCGEQIEAQFATCWHCARTSERP